MSVESRLIVPEEYERNLGFMTLEEQQYKLGSAVVSIGGAGGDGGMLAIGLARLGVGAEGGEIRLADPDPFERQNRNRQAGSNIYTDGRNKAVVIGEAIEEINPRIGVKVYTEGVTQENADEFVRGATLLIDETEFSMHAIGALLARTAREHGVPNMHVINVGFGAQVTSYAPDSKKRHTLEGRLGIPLDATFEEASNVEVGVDKWLAWMPPYADLEAFTAVVKGKSAPSVVQGVAIAAGMGVTEAMLHILGEGNNRQKPTVFPSTKVYDAMAGYAATIRHPRLRITTSMAKMAIRSKLGRNPSTNYV